MRHREAEPLFRQLATACPRTNVLIEQPEQGGFDILWINNLGKLRLQHFIAHDGIPFISEQAAPRLFEQNGRLVKQPDYTLLHIADDQGRIWIIEALSLITDGQEICFNLVKDGNAIRFIYGYCTETGKQEIQRVSLEMDARQKNRFLRDNFVARYQYRNGQRKITSTKLRLNQHIEQEIVQAKEQRLRSTQFHNLTGVDDEIAIQLLVTNNVKIIADDSIPETELITDFIEQLSCVTETTRCAIKTPLVNAFNVVILALSAKEGAGKHQLKYQDGAVEVTYPSGEMAKFRPETINGSETSRPLARSGSDIDDFVLWSRAELSRVSEWADMIF